MHDRKFMSGIMAVVFLLGSCIFPYIDVYAYREMTNPKKEKVLGKVSYKVQFKKVRCPECGMEFFVKEMVSPFESLQNKRHDEEVALMDEYGEFVEYQTGKPQFQSDAMNTGGGLLPDPYQQFSNNVFNDSDESDGDDFSLFDAFAHRARLSEKEMAESDRQQLQEQLEAESITCPYDGHRFHPRYSPLEIQKMVGDVKKDLSPIENAFLQTGTSHVNRALEQFGYDVFPREEKEKTTEEQKKREALISGQAGQIGGSAGGMDDFFKTQVADALTPVPVETSYVLGPGDSLIINVWGAAQDAFSVTVDSEGKIVLPKAGPVYVWGLVFGEAEKLIEEQLMKYYSNFQIDISMGKLRAIRVFILGEVEQPGAYTLNANTTAFNALYAAGGPKKLGSLRSIKILRSGVEERVVDLYDLLLKGNKQSDIMLLSGDTIFIPPVGNVVGITGNVKRPAIYEINGGMSLKELLMISGGITPTGNNSRFQLERIVDGKRKMVLDLGVGEQVNFTEFAQDVMLQNGDMVIISSIERLRRNFVTVMGSVQTPGDFELAPRMSVRDLITKASGILPGTYLPRAEIARVSQGRVRQIIPVDLGKILSGDGSENVLLEEWDVLLVYSKSDVTTEQYVEIYGEVEHAGTYEFSPGMRVTDLVFQAGGFNGTATRSHVELFKLVPGEQPHVLRLDLTKNENPILHPGDQVFIRKSAEWQKRKLIELKGEVKYPGKYAVLPGERLSSIIRRAGGYSENAYLDGAIFTRESIRKAQRRAVKKFVEMQRHALLQARSVAFSRTVFAEDIPKQELLFTDWQQSIERLATQRVAGRMVVRLASLEELTSSKYDILIEDGDTLEIPQVPPTVDVMGSVSNAASVLYEQKRGIDYYIEKAGGLTQYADSKHIFVIKANGEAVGRFARVKEIHRGDTIIVPSQMAAVPSAFRSYLELMSRLVLSAGVVAAIMD